MRAIAQYNRPWNRTQFILKMTAHSSTTDFDHFNALDCRAGIKTFRQIVYSHHSQAPKGVFNLELGGTIPWKDIRININHLLHLLEGLDGRSRFDFRQQDLIMDRTSHDEGCNSWAKLQIDFLVLLSDIFLCEPSRGLQPLPDLWINGEGQLLHASYPSSTNMDSLHQFDYKHAHIDSHVLHKEIQDLKHTIKCSSEYGQTTPQSQLRFPWVNAD